MFTRRSLILAAVFALVLAGVAFSGTEQLQAKDAETMTVEFAWDGNGGSLSSPNPQLNIGNIPEGTVSFKVQMDDLNRKNFKHGGGTVANDGTGIIPVGALNKYKGPQPPRPEVHTYVFTVSALDAKGKVIGRAKASRKYPEK